MRTSGPPKGVVTYLVLELLAEGPRYGYEIQSEIAELSGGHWEPSYGSVYPILHKCEEKGWARRVERSAEPDRKYFELTDAGETELDEKRAEVGASARDFGDVVLGFYHIYVALATDERFGIEERDTGWSFDRTFSAWIVEQFIRHHERYFGSFERIEDTPDEFYKRTGVETSEE
ncbi:MAG: PadR family transcriptional regulator [Halodesulfurarchaeum sp.]